MRPVNDIGQRPAHGACRDYHAGRGAVVRPRKPLPWSWERGLIVTSFLLSKETYVTSYLPKNQDLFYEKTVDRAGVRELLHARRQVGRMADRHVVGMQVILANRTQHHFAGVDPHPHLQRRIAFGAQRIRIAAHRFLHTQRGI